MQRNSRLVFLILLIASLAFPSDAKPIVSNSAMSLDQLAVYQAFLNSYNNGSKSRLNLSKRTSTLNLAEEGNDGCLKGIQFDSSSRSNSFIHEFDPQVAFLAKIRLVDPEDQRKAIQQNDPGNAIRQGRDVNGAVESGFAAGLLTLSEVAFDKSHRYAVMSFSFVCGGLCDHGSTVVLEKKDGKWKESKRQCSMWMS